MLRLFWRRSTIRLDSLLYLPARQAHNPHLAEFNDRSEGPLQRDGIARFGSRVTMITKIAKVLTVLVATLSILFMGVALAIHSTSPSWKEDLQNLPDYDFSYTGGESPTWNVKRREANSPQLASSATLPAVIAKAYEDQATRNKAATDLAIQPIQNLQAQTADIRVSVEIDKKALGKRIDQLNLTLKDVSQKVSDLALAGDKLTKQANAIREEARDRREDKDRLLRQLQQIEADHFHLAAQEQRLLDTLFQLQGELRRLQMRNQQLLEQGAKLPGPAAAPVPKAETAKLDQPK